MSQRVKLALFVAFVVADLVLLGLLVQHQRATTRNVPDEPSPTATPSSTPEVKVTVDVGLAANGSFDTIARIMRGSCTGTGQPKLETSVDNGKTFEELALPLLEQPNPTEPTSAAKPVRTVLAVTVRSTEKLAIVAGDDKCDPHAYRTNDGGETWKRQDEISGWYVDAAGDGVVSPRGPSEPGCEIRALSSFSATSANVICAGGRVRNTFDGGVTWTPFGVLRELHTATFTDPRQGYAIATGDTCVRSFTSADAGITWKPGGCVGLARVGAMIGDGSTMIVTDGVDVRVTTNGGEEWTKP
jgi:hypothetical protein